MKEELKNMELDDTSLEKVTGGTYGGDTSLTDASQCDYFNSGYSYCPSCCDHCEVLRCWKVKNSRPQN